jgi:hypothetical protein
MDEEARRMKRHRRRRPEATPLAHMILSKRMADHKPHDMVCELVDNAFDAQAKRVWIELGRRSLTVADDGSGMEDVNDAIRFGKGTKAQRRGGVLGRFGVGMTDALCRLGPRARVSTLRDRGLRGLSVDWDECLRNQHFPYLDDRRPQPARAIDLVDGIVAPSGTVVYIHGQPPGIHLDTLCRLLTERYAPGIWGNREIFVRREGQAWVSIEDMDPGPLTDVIEYESEIEGMAYHVYGGLMVNRNVVYNRTFIGYAYRFVEETTELFKGISTAHLQVFLGDEWKDCLGTHKNRLDRHREELFEDIRARAKEWLERAARKAEALQLQSLALELEDYLTKMADPAGDTPAVSRRQGAAQGKRVRKEPGKAAEATGSAGDELAKPKRGIGVAWDPALRQMGELRVEGGGEIVVTLNPDDPRIRVLREQRDCPGLAHIICSYVAQYATVSDENARQVLRAGILRGADPALRPHELYAYYYDSVDQPAVAHESGRTT